MCMLIKDLQRSGVYLLQIKDLRLICGIGTFKPLPNGIRNLSEILFP